MLLTLFGKTQKPAILRGLFWFR